MKHLTVLVLLLGIALGDEKHGHSTCRRSWEKVGCFREAAKVKTLWTDRGTDPTHNHTIDWKNYTPYLFELACRCKTLAEAKGFQYFGLRNYGDCTGIANLTGAVRYSDSEPNCVQEQFKKCNSSSESECIGKGFYEFIYKIGVDGGWSGFGDWGSCDKECGGGVQSRRRTCSNPSPSSNGALCVGAAEETRPCNQQPCAVVNGGWTDFGEWSTCSKSCNGGTQSRTRSCTNPSPNRYGNPCMGEAVESRICNQWTMCADPASSFPGCKLENGKGEGGSQMMVGQVANPQECFNICFKKRQADPYVNGASVLSATGQYCTCEMGMIGSDLNPIWKTCKFGESPVVQFHGCNWVFGNGISGGDIYIGQLGEPRECVAACLQRRFAGDYSINGASVDGHSGKTCYCEQNMTGSNSSKMWRTCQIA